MRLVALTIIPLLIVGDAPRAEEFMSPATRTLTLVRHGHYVADPAADPALGPGLSTTGRQQARMVAQRLAAAARPDVLYVSPLQRARDTAQAVTAALDGREFEVLPELEECTPSARAGVLTYAVTAEEHSACEAQLTKLYERHFRPAEGAPRHELMVCHGNVIRWLVTRALGVEPTAWTQMSLGHTSITRVRIDANRQLRVIAAGDVGHLPPGLLTGAMGDPEPLPVP